jgi:hypothetical protein
MHVVLFLANLALLGAFFFQKLALVVEGSHNSCNIVGCVPFIHQFNNPFRGIDTMILNIAFLNSGKWKIEIHCILLVLSQFLF